MSSKNFSAALALTLAAHAPQANANMVTEDTLSKSLSPSVIVYTQKQVDAICATYPDDCKLLFPERSVSVSHKKAPIAKPDSLKTGLALTTLAGLGLGIGAYMLRPGRRKKDSEASKDEVESEFMAYHQDDELFGSSPSESEEKTELVGSPYEDPVLEADIYLGYGFETQAEDILKKELEWNADFPAVRKKLLEMYASRKDRKSFEEQFLEFRERCAWEDDLLVQAMNLGLTIDPMNTLYSQKTKDTKSTNSWEDFSMTPSDFTTEMIPGTKFNATVQWTGELATGISQGGKNFMDDYVVSFQDQWITRMVVLDGVSDGDRKMTGSFVAFVADHLKSMTLMDFLAESEKHLSEFGEFDLATTIGQTIIQRNLLSLEKMGDIGAIVFDSSGAIKHQNISGWFIPDSWFGSDEMADIDEMITILDRIREYGFWSMDSRDLEDMTQSDFMQRFGNYTLQMWPSVDNDASYVNKESWTLSSWDIVVMATDGVFDNISVQHLWRITRGSSGSAKEDIKLIFQTLNAQSAQGMNDFWVYKEDNIGISVYHHTAEEDSERPTEESLSQETDKMPLSSSDLPTVDTSADKTFPTEINHDSISIKNKSENNAYKPTISPQFIEYVEWKKFVSLNDIKSTFWLSQKESRIIIEWLIANGYLKKEIHQNLLSANMAVITWK